jgi:hypothetical protein
VIGRAALGGLALAFVLAACGEKVQSMSSDTKKPDAPGWKGGNPAYNAPGWVASDQAAWEAQLRSRAQSQNDYAIPATTK